MKSKAIVCAITAACLSFSAVSFAQNNDRRSGYDEGARPHQQGQQQRDRENYGHQVRGPEHHDESRFDRPDFRRNDRMNYYNARSPEFRRGAYIPYEYRNRQYVVTDYRTHRLSPPPRGQQWVQVGPDYVLMAIATGLIAQIILSH